MKPPSFLVAIDNARCFERSDQRSMVWAIQGLFLAGSRWRGRRFCSFISPRLYDVDVLPISGVLRPASNPLEMPPSLMRKRNDRESGATFQGGQTDQIVSFAFPGEISDTNTQTSCSAMRPVVLDIFRGIVGFQGSSIAGESRRQRIGKRSGNLRLARIRTGLWIRMRAQDDQRDCCCNPLQSWIRSCSRPRGAKFMRPWHG